MRWELVGQWPAPHGGAWRSVARRQARTAAAGHVAANACRSIPSAGSGGRLLGARCERRRRNVRPSGTSGRRCTHGAPRAGTATSSPPTCPASPSRLPRWSAKIMSSTKKLEDITLGQQNCKILGRLTRLWSSRNMRSNSANSLINIDGIIIDKNGEMVQITVPKKLQKQFQPLLAQGHGSVHLFTNLSAIDTKQRTHIYHHKTTCSSSSPPQRSIVLTHEEITSPALHSNSAHMISCHQRHYIEATSSEQTEEVRLWGEHGEAFDEADVIEKSKQGIVVAIFVGLTAGSFKGVTQASSSSATQIFIDLDIPDITNFRESYKWEAPPLQQHVPQVLQLSPIQAAGQIYKLNQITELPTSSFQGGATYSCIAKISAIVPSTNWYYKVCRSCKVGYDSISEDPRCDCPAPKPMPMYKLPITITDDTGSINTIAFSFIAEDLVERSAYHASQNMKIGATEPAVAFEKAIGKTRLFHIGMGTNSSSSFAIKYVIRKSFPIDNPSSPLKATPIMPALPSPPQNTGSESSKAKRSLEFKEDTKCSEEQQQTTSDTLPKRQKPKLADDNTTEDTTKSSQNNLPNNKI